MAKREEQLKNEIGHKFFKDFDTTQILGDVDFTVSVRYGKDDLYSGRHYLLWAEAKRGTKADMLDSIVQLIFTIGKARTFKSHIPPVFLGAFDEEKIAFIPYHKVQEVFFQNDFDWTAAPSDHKTKEFLQLKELVSKEIKGGEEVYVFFYNQANKGLEKFIKKNFKIGKKRVEGLTISKNNFVFIYQKWCKEVKNTIQVDWNGLKKMGILDSHFFLADMLSDQNKGVYEKLQVILDRDHYDLDRKVVDGGLFEAKQATFRDGMKAHTLFWNQYKRPPRKEFWDYFIERADLLVPQDVRERKGSYFTPQIWVEKSQQYIADVFGEDWEDEYYIWDCCAGTGNMEVGLKNKYHVWASTLDMADVKIMHERISNGANLLPKHVFQFDFLNDELTEDKLPSDLLEVFNDPEKRKKLIVYINPPYAETANKKINEANRKNKRGVSFTSVQKRFSELIGIATKELFAQFFIRVKYDLPGCHLAEFSKMKFVQGPNFAQFREAFTAKFEKGFVVPANTFDNVKGKFPIGFMIWNLDSDDVIDTILCDVCGSKGEYLGEKTFFGYDKCVFVTDWFRPYHSRIEGQQNIGAIGLYGSDFQHNNFIYITNPSEHTNRWTYITEDNLIPSCIYLSLRHAIEATWLNDRDQFLFPTNEWANDKDFQSDCLAYTLFHGQNRIMSGSDRNHWIPFTEDEVGAQMTFTSHFMSDYIKGKRQVKPDLFDEGKSEPIEFTPLAQAVMDAGKEIWKYYHSMMAAEPNASFYDIREFFQGRDEKTGKMNNSSDDERYTSLMKDLRDKQALLAEQIEEKIYQYGFLKK